VSIEKDSAWLYDIIFGYFIKTLQDQHDPEERNEFQFHPYFSSLYGMEKGVSIFIFNILIPCKKPYDYIGIQQGYHAFHPSTNPIFVASLMSSFPVYF